MWHGSSFYRRVRDREGEGGGGPSGLFLLTKRTSAACSYLEDHVHLAEAGQSLVPDGGQQLLNVRVRHELNRSINQNLV
jgi:hypothetical protein